MTFNKGVTGGEGLGKAHHCIVNRRIAVRMVFAENVADKARTLSEGLVGLHTQLVHCVKNAPVNGFQPVAHIGKRTADDNSHCV